MYIFNGFVYGSSEFDKSIKISSVKTLDDMIMLLTFSNGETRLFDASVLKGEVFKPLLDDKVFKNCKLEYGVVTWMDGAIDCAPEFMYENSYEYEFVWEWSKEIVKVLCKAYIF